MYIVKCFLFNDIVVWAHKVRSTWKYKGQIKIEQTWTRDLIDKDEIKNCFQVFTEAKAHTFIAKSEDVKSQWLVDINEAKKLWIEGHPNLASDKPRPPVKMTLRKGMFNMAFKKDCRRDLVSVKFGAPPKLVDDQAASAPASLISQGNLPYSEPIPSENSYKPTEKFCILQVWISGKQK